MFEGDVQNPEKRTFTNPFLSLSLIFVDAEAQLPGTSLLYFQEHVRLKWGKFAVKVFRLAGQIPITLIGDPL